MQLILSILAVMALVLPPGWAAVSRARRQGAVGPGDGLAALLAIGFSGVALACVALWLTFMAVGPSAIAVVLAIVAITAIVRWAPPIGLRDPATSPPRDIESREAEHTPKTLIFCAALAVVLVAIPFLPYGQGSDETVYAMAMTDWEKHIVVATAIAGADHFPPPHPYARDAGPASYYAGFHLLAAAAALLTRSGDVYCALLMLTLLTAAAMPFVAYRFARLLVAPTTAVAAAVGATLLAGFDLIVVGLQSVRAVVSNWPLPGDLDGLRIAVPSSHLDSWIHHVERQFNAPLIATMWAPHHVAAVLVALVVFILLAPRSDNPHLPRSGALVPGLLVGALPALSAYVAMALAAGVAGAVLRESLAERIAPYRSTVFSRWWRVGAISAVAAIPTYRVLSAGSSSSLTFAISGSGDLANGAFFNTFFGASTWSNLLDTPAVLFFDLGLVGVLSAVWILRPPKRLSRNQLDAIAVAATILVLVVFVRPQEGIGNNLYARGMLLVWFVLAPLAAAAAGSVRRSVLVPLAIVSVLGTGYAAAGSVAESMLFRGHPREDVDAMQWVNSNLPAQTVVAFHPQEYGNTDTYWLRRSIVLGNRRLAGLFGATGAQVAEAELELTQAYSAPDQKTAARRFDALGADVMLLRSPWYRDRTDRRPVAEPAPDVALWAQAPCFRLAHQSPAWMIIQRLEGDC